jgi:hypothetical protein
MAQQTAVIWLFEQIPFEWSSSRAAFEALQQAKAMEKEQISDAYRAGHKDGWSESDGFTQDFETTEQYYNETYQSNKD